MDPERQPLLGPSTSNVRCRNRSLTSAEVRACRDKLPWRRAHLTLALVFWTTVAALTVLALYSLRGSAPCVRPPSLLAAEPAARLTLPPLVPTTRFINHVYAM